MRFPNRFHPIPVEGTWEAVPPLPGGHGFSWREGCVETHLAAGATKARAREQTRHRAGPPRPSHGVTSAGRSVLWQQAQEVSSALQQGAAKPAGPPTARGPLSRRRRPPGARVAAVLTAGSPHQTPRPPGARSRSREAGTAPGQNAPVSARCQPPGVVLAPATAGSCGTLTGRTRLGPPLHTRLVGWGPAGRQTLGNRRRGLLKAGGGRRGAPTKHTTHNCDCSCHARG